MGAVAPGTAPKKDLMTETFTDLGLGEDVLRAVADAGYETPTPIQAKAIPYVLMGRDILGCAQTGTGKTASFTLPMIDILAQGRGRARMPRSVILAPTRELAAQVAENFETYGKYHKLTMALLIGGVSFGEQEKKLDRGVDVLIATPGRLIDHTERGKVILTDVKVLVIDEADRMLDMGFIPDVERLVGLMPVIRQTLMFSATMPKEIRRLAEKFLMNPKEMAVDPPSSTAETVEQRFVRCERRAKRKTLRALLDSQDLDNALIFCNRKRDVAELYRSLARSNYPVGALHGDMDQYKRMEWLEKFRTGECKILICSDVAARGLDIASVSHVYNFDVPINAEDYVHRIGRTGRAGRSGAAYTLLTDDDAKAWASIKKMVKKEILELEIPLAGGRQPEKSDQDEAAEDSAAVIPEEAPPSDATEKPRRSSRGRGRSARDEGNGAEPARGGRSRGGRGRGAYDAGVEPELTTAFGDSDQVPAFLRR